MRHLIIIAVCLTALLFIAGKTDKRVMAEGEWRAMSIIDICRKYGKFVTLEMEPRRAGTLTVRCDVRADIPELDEWR